LNSQTYPHSKEFVQDVQDPTFTDLPQTRHRRRLIQFIQGRSIILDILLSS